jgi:hypothetical protein
VFQEAQYAISKEKGEELQSSVTLLQHTSKLVQIFNSMAPLKDLSDQRLKTLLDVLTFFESWEQEAKSRKIATSALMSAQCREDLQCTILVFLEMCRFHIQKYGSSIVPGRVNSDIVENTYVLSSQL